MGKQQLRGSRLALAILATCALVACDSGGGSGGAGTSAGSGTAGAAGTTGTGGTIGGLPGAGTGGAMAGTTGTAGVMSTAGVPGAGMGGAAGTAGMGGAAGTAGAGGTGGDGVSACDLACDPGKHCELTVVQCIKAPCPPLEECVDDPHCGGFAGLPCPGMGSCTDDPRDSCDPMNGGADCGGICACADTATCADGQKWDSSPTVCACVASDSMGKGDGEACGDATCDKGMVCCNASCGICAPPDGFCTQMACL